MTSIYHTPLVTGQSNAAGTFNSPLSELDSQLAAVVGAQGGVLGTTTASDAIEQDASTTLDGNHATGATTINVISAANIVAGEIIVITLDDATTHAAKVVSKSTNELKVFQPLPSPAASTNAVKTYEAVLTLGTGEADSFTNQAAVVYTLNDATLSYGSVTSGSGATLTISTSDTSGTIPSGVLVTQISESEYLASGGYDTISHRLDGIDKYPGAARLSAATSIGDTTISLRTAPNLVGTDLGYAVIDPYTTNCEIRRIASVSGTTVTLDPLITYTPLAATVSFTGAGTTITDTGNRLYDFRTSYALVTPQVTVTGSSNNNGTYQYNAAVAGTLTITGDTFNAESNVQATLSVNLIYAHAADDAVLFIPSLAMVYPEWFGAKTAHWGDDIDNFSDMSGPIALADFHVARGGIVKFSQGQYRINTQILKSAFSVWEGANPGRAGFDRYGTVLKANGSSLDNSWMVNIEGDSVGGLSTWGLYGGGMRDIALHGGSRGNPQVATHDGADNVSVLTDSTQSWLVDELIGATVYNKTDGSSGTITDNTATTVTATLAGGAGDDWVFGDAYYFDFFTPVTAGGVHIGAGVRQQFFDGVNCRWLTYGIGSTTGSGELLFDRCFMSSVKYGFYFTGQLTDSYFRHCLAGSGTTANLEGDCGGGAGWYLQRAKSITFDSCRMQVQKGDGTNGQGGYFLSCYGLIFNNCILDANEIQGMWIRNSMNVAINNVLSFTNGLTTANAPGIQIHSQGVTISSVDTGTEELTIPTMPLRTGQIVQVANSGGALPTGLSAATDYYVIRTNDTTVKLATTYTNALAGTAINITGAGSGTNYLLPVAGDTTITGGMSWDNRFGQAGEVMDRAIDFRASGGGGNEIIRNVSIDNHVMSQMTTPISDMNLVTNYRNPTWQIVEDPADGNAIVLYENGYCPLVTGGAETRTLAAPSFPHQTLQMYLKTDGGDCVVTVATGVNQAGNTSLTFADAGDEITLRAIEVGTDLRWRVVSNDGVALA